MLYLGLAVLGVLLVVFYYEYKLHSIKYKQKEGEEDEDVTFWKEKYNRCIYNNKKLNKKVIELKRKYEQKA